MLKEPQKNKNNSGEQEHHVYRVYGKNLETNQQQYKIRFFWEEPDKASCCKQLKCVDPIIG